MGNWGVDLQGFFGDAAFLLRRHGAESAHVVQAVGKFDHYDSDVLGHGQSHFLKIFGLLFRLRLVFDLGQLADAIHQLGNDFTELLTDRVF